jgi:hypothetical protein
MRRTSKNPADMLRRNFERNRKWQTMQQNDNRPALRTARRQFRLKSTQARHASPATPFRRKPLGGLKSRKSPTRLNADQAERLARGQTKR